MRDLFFGVGAIMGWTLAGIVLVFLASWIWLIVREVGGIRGTALATLLSCLAILFFCFALLLSKESRIPHALIGVIATVVCCPMPVAAFVLADLYSADRNNHRSFTTRSYLWYKRNVADAREESSPRHSITIHENM